MPAEDNQEKEFIIPTGYKERISSQLSWPTGALEITRAFASAPQLRQMRLIFRQHYPVPHQGKWPSSFPVVELQYANGRSTFLHSSDWQVYVYPVPRNLRAEVREQVALRGFQILSQWLNEHVRISGNAGSLRYSCVWNSELKVLTFESHDYVLPVIALKNDTPKR